MELKDFVKETLIEISQGVLEAQTEQGDALINPRVKLHEKEVGRIVLAEDGAGRGIRGGRILDYVEFDIAVTLDKNTNTDGKISVLFGAINLSSGGASENKDSSTSRVKFRVPVSFSVKNNGDVD
jgi:hypothetical protein